MIPLLLSAQEEPLWNASNTNTRIADSRWEGTRTSRKVLNKQVLTTILEEIRTNGSSSLSIPHPGGDLLEFVVQPSHLLAPGLQEKFPEIRTLKGTNERGDRVRIDVNSKELHAIIYTIHEGVIYLDPESQGSKHYVSYFQEDYIFKNGDQETFEEPPAEAKDLDHHHHLGARRQNEFTPISIGNELRKYRIAIAAESRYTAFHGGTVAGAMEAITTVLNRVTGVLENDLAITFELIDGNEAIIFTSNDSDPYRGRNTASALKQHNTEVLKGVIGEDNYDIGHVFAAINGGGVAQRGGVCGALKASAASTRSSPVGDPFYINYVAHEIGHQLGAPHSFNACTGRHEESAYEPGSGSTIMSYAGICASNDIQRNPDDYFHGGSIHIIANHIENFRHNCYTRIETGNTPPTVNIREGGFVIPINTPFVLEADGSDADGDVLTYCWEQYDLGPLISLGSASETSPLFRSFPPTTSNKRYFPKLSNVVEGRNTRGEILPTYTRDLNFMITVRDNNINGGGITNATVGFSSTEEAGPFVVTSEFSEPEYAGFSDLLVEWDVANTNAAPVNCQQVTILYSDNGGESFDAVLLENTDNDGSETVKLPNIATSKARIMVKAADNIFFHINDTDFTVVPSEVDVPGTPIDLTGNKVNPTTIELSWTDSGDLEDGFIIERKTGTAPGFVEIGRTALDVTSYTDENIDEALPHSYRVAAYNATGTSGYTNIVSFSGDVDVVVSLEDNQELEFVYPNPASDKLSFNSHLVNQIDEIRIFDTKGQKVIDHKMIDSVEEHLDISFLSKGLYLMHILMIDRKKIINKFYKN